MSYNLAFALPSFLTPRGANVGFTLDLEAMPDRRAESATAPSWIVDQKDKEMCMLITGSETKKTHMCL